MAKVILNEEEICKEYVDTTIGVEAMALKYHVGKKRIRDILNRHNIAIKGRGGQTLKEEFVVADPKQKKYVNGKDYHYIVKDKYGDWVSKDIDNRGGFLTSFIREKYAIEIPSLYDRDKYYQRTGDYWWEQFLTYEKVKNADTKCCPYCDWETIDVENKSGVFEQHILKEHSISKSEYLEQFPTEIEYFTKLKREMKRNSNLQRDGNFVVCPLCNQRFYKLTESHLLSKHNMTIIEFKKQYPSFNVMSKSSLSQINDVRKFANLVVSKDRFISKYEKELQEFFECNNIPMETNRQLLIGKEIDLLSEKHKIGIEFDGLKFHTEYFGNKSRQYHLEKTERCNENGYGLIHIFEDEYVNNTRLVYEKLKHIFHITDGKERIHGRKCVVREIYKYQAEEFLNKFHIQGFVYSSVYLGAFFNDKLVAVMCFKNGTINNPGWELVRFATDYDYIVNGIGGKLFKHFVTTYKVDYVSSFADRRWTVDINNNFYTKIGFQLDKINGPDYKYYNEKVSRYERVNKRQFSKTNLIKKYGFPETMTESQMTKELGYDRIWDCGLVKYVWRR